MNKLIKIGIGSLVTILIIIGVSSFSTSTKLVSNSESLEGFWYSWEDGLKKAKAEDKIILVDVYTTWCGWCVRMDKDTYSKDSIQKLLSDHFVPIKINPEIEATYTIADKTYTGSELIKFLARGKRYEGYPITYFWLDPKKENKGKRKYLQQGYLDPTQMSQTLRRIMKIKK